MHSLIHSEMPLKKKLTGYEHYSIETLTFQSSVSDHLVSRFWSRIPLSLQDAAVRGVSWTPTSDELTL